MKIVRLLSVSYLKDIPYTIFFSHCKEKTYEECLDCFRNEKLLHPNKFPDAMQKFGCEVQDFIVDFPPLYKYWGANLDEALFAFVSHHKPNILYFEREAFRKVSLRLQDQLKSVCGVEKIVGYWGAQVEDNFDGKVFFNTDVLFTIDETLAETFQPFVPKTVVLRACYDSNCEPFIPFDQREIDIGFFGTSGYGYQDHVERFLFLREICMNSDLHVFCDTPLRNIPAEIKNRLIYSLSKLPESVLSFGEQYFPWKAKAFSFARETKKSKLTPYSCYSYRPLHMDFPNHTYDQLFGNHYEEGIRKTKIALNKHIDNCKIFGNMRTYETTALGAVLLTDRPNQLGRFFDLDYEIVGYSSIEEALEKMRYLQDHPNMAEKIAQAGQKKTLSKHTIYNRAEIIIHHLNA